MEMPPQQQAWGAYPAPMMMPPMPMYQQQQPQQEYYGNLMIDPNTGYPIDPVYFHQQAMMHHQQYGGGGPQYGMPMPTEATHFNAEAKEFIPGSSG